ncbi:hypothetical protein [Leucothrix arctica]|uniref:Uncharacterized protein n=1 Tax=Leucothrix arctica TaxID=1481894 RepID=A0A317CKT6_9GAMM|nr:hypothetical protein [Leucothrix arctica]PWQ96940.1 hypothetical protein DKT75_07835 [Leucothrix arctica]
MTDNLYAPPEANLHKPSDKGEPYVRGFDKPMVIAIILLAAFSVLTLVIMYVTSPEDFIFLNEAVGTVINVIGAIIVVSFIKRLRVQGLGTPVESAGKALGIWGYFWRTLIAQFVAVFLLMIPLVVILILLDHDLDSALSSLTASILLGIAMVPASIFCVWAFYSKDRSGQLSSFFSLFRGY